ASAAAEFGAEFRSDVQSFVDREIVEACISYGIRERPPDRKLRYLAFCDPSGGSRDSFTLAIGHADTNRQEIVIDCIRELRAPLSREATWEEFAKVVKSYRCYRVHGDRFAGEWPREQFCRFGISYEVAKPNKSELYAATLPLINSARLQLLDEPRSIGQLLNL